MDPLIFLFFSQMYSPIDRRRTKRTQRKNRCACEKTATRLPGAHPVRI